GPAAQGGPQWHDRDQPRLLRRRGDLGHRGGDRLLHLPAGQVQRPEGHHRPGHRGVQRQPPLDCVRGGADRHRAGQRHPAADRVLHRDEPATGEGHRAELGDRRGHGHLVGRGIRHGVRRVRRAADRRRDLRRVPARHGERHHLPVRGGAQALTHLDAIGNTTKAITKGIAIATAVLAATALFGAFRTTITQALGSAGGTFSLSVDRPRVLVGVIIGASVVFMFASLLISAVGRAAQRVVLEVRNQFRTHPGIMDYTEKPDYGRVVDICTKDSLRELVTPALLAVLIPIAVGFAFGYATLGAYLAGAIAVGVLMAVFLANSGGAWDNAKKLVEEGQHGGKGSEAHAATVIGDTVGDPFKDTAGPAINPLLKVINLVSLLVATSVVKYSSNVG